jgi:hypothetical protein
MTLTRSSARAAILLLLLPLLLPAAVSAQQLPLKRAMPDVAWAGCPPLGSLRAAEPPAARRAEAERVAASAMQASILGDHAAAVSLLTTAAALDPTSASIAYHHARTLEELGRADAALGEYCRYLALAPATTDTADAAEVRHRMAALTTPGRTAATIPSTAARAFEAGLAHYAAGRLDAAEAAFGQAIQEVPLWSDAVYNRAVVRLALRRTRPAAADLHRYLELDPGAADQAAVLAALAAAADASRAPADPRTALVAGLVIPGMGHFTTGRPATGLLVFAGAAAALTAGLSITRLEVDCLSVPVDGRCPPGLVVDERVERPYLLPGALAAAAIGVLGALDAHRGARRRDESGAQSRAGSPASGSSAGDVSVSGPVLTIGPRGPQLALVRVKF